MNKINIKNFTLNLDMKYTRKKYTRKIKGTSLTLIGTFKARIMEIDDKMKEIAKAEKAKKVQKSVDEIMDKVLEFVKENKSNMTVIKPIVDRCKEAGVKPTEVTDIELAKELLAMIE